MLFGAAPRIDAEIRGVLRQVSDVRVQVEQARQAGVRRQIQMLRPGRGCTHGEVHGRCGRRRGGGQRLDGHDAPSLDAQPLAFAHAIGEAIDQLAAVDHQRSTGDLRQGGPGERVHDAMPMIEPIVERLHRDAFVQAVRELVLGADEDLADPVGWDAAGAEEQTVGGARLLDRDDGDARMPCVHGGGHRLQDIVA